MAAVLEVPAEPEWSLEGCCNFRDVGGYAAADASVVRKGTLFRSDSLAAASVGDTERLVRHGVRTVVDLRSDDERTLAGVFRAGGVRVEHIPLADLMAADAGREFWHAPERIAARYFGLCTEAADAVAEVVAVLTDPAAYPAVIHCSVGKDRTGVVVAIILRSLGVSPTDVVRDFARSAAGRLHLVQRLRQEMAPEELEPYLPALLAAEPATMRGFLGRVDDEFGSVPRYLASIDMESAVGYLRAALLT